MSQGWPVRHRGSTPSRRWLRLVVGLVVATLIAAICTAVGVTYSLQTKVTVLNTVTLTYNPLSGKFSLSADPFNLVTKYVSVKFGAGVDLTPDSGNATVVIRSPTAQTVLQVPATGSWSLEATDVAGSFFTIGYDGAARQYRVDLSKTYVRQLRLIRSSGATWSTSPRISRAHTHTVVVDTSLLTTGEFSYCRPRLCGIYMHTFASRDSPRALLPSGDPVSVSNGTRLQAICEAGGGPTTNDRSETSLVWEYVVYRGLVGYVPAIWTGSFRKKPVKICGS